MDQNKDLQPFKPDNREVTKYDFLICPNCSTEEVGKYCPNCGQFNKDYNKPLKEIFSDLMDSINLDIRLIKTLVPFFFKPGYLTQEYFKGKRRRYVPPMRMYILFSVLFFFLAKFTDLDSLKEMGKVTGNSMTDSINHEVSMAITEAENQFKIGIEQAGIPLDSSNVVYAEVLKDTAKWFPKNVQWTTETNRDTTQRSLNDFSPEEIQKLKDEIEADTTLSKGVKEVVGGTLNVTEKMDLFWDKFLNNASYVLFLLMPFFALILALTLWRSKKLYVHHLIFSINYHSFIFGFSSLLIVLGMILPEKLVPYLSYLFWGYPLYLMFGIRRFYKRSIVGAFFKTFGITLLYSLIISIVVIIIIVFTAKGFYEG